MHRVSVRVSDLHWAALEDDVVDVKRLTARPLCARLSESNIRGLERGLAAVEQIAGGGSHWRTLQCERPTAITDTGEVLIKFRQRL